MTPLLTLLLEVALQEAEIKKTKQSSHLLYLSQSVCLQCERPGFDPWVGKIPWRRKWQPIPVFLPGEPHGWRSLVGYSPWGCKELDTTERLYFTSSLHFTSLHFPFLNLALLPIISRGKHSTQGHLLVVEISKTVYRDQAMMLSLWVTANQETGKSGRAPFPI